MKMKKDWRLVVVWRVMCSRATVANSCMSNNFHFRLPLRLVDNSSDSTSSHTLRRFSPILFFLNNISLKRLSIFPSHSFGSGVN